MSIAFEELKSEMTALSVVERAELARFLIQTLDDEPGRVVEAAWNIELARRSDEIRSGKLTGKADEQVFREIRARHSKSRSSSTPRPRPSWKPALPSMKVGVRGLALPSRKKSSC